MVQEFIASSASSSSLHRFFSRHLLCVFFFRSGNYVSFRLVDETHFPIHFYCLWLINKFDPEMLLFFFYSQWTNWFAIVTIWMELEDSECVREKTRTTINRWPPEMSTMLIISIGHRINECLAQFSTRTPCNHVKTGSPPPEPTTSSIVASRAAQIHTQTRWLFVVTLLFWCHWQLANVSHLVINKRKHFYSDFVLCVFFGWWQRRRRQQ